MIITYKYSASASFIMKKRWKNIDWKKVFKYWAIFQSIILLSKLDKIQENIFFIIAFPLVIILFLLIRVFSSEKSTQEKDILNQREFEDYEKAFNRQKKIDKIL
jgi:hypothetical protein